MLERFCTSLECFWQQYCIYISTIIWEKLLKNSHHNCLWMKYFLGCCSCQSGSKKSLVRKKKKKKRTEIKIEIKVSSGQTACELIVTSLKNLQQKLFSTSSVRQKYSLEDPRETGILNITSTPLFSVFLSFICSSAHQYFSTLPMAQTNHWLMKANVFVSASTA